MSNIKRKDLIGKILPDVTDKASMEPIQKKGSYCPYLFVYQKTGSWCFFSLKVLGVSSFIDEGSPDTNLAAFEQNSAVSLSLPEVPLNSGACFSSLLINVFCGIFFFSIIGHFHLN